MASRTPNHEYRISWNYNVSSTCIHRHLEGSSICGFPGGLVGYGNDKVSLVASDVDRLLCRRVALDGVCHPTGHEVSGLLVVSILCPIDAQKIVSLGHKMEVEGGVVVDQRSAGDLAPVDGAEEGHIACIERVAIGDRRQMAANRVQAGKRNLDVFTAPILSFAELESNRVRGVQLVAGEEAKNSILL